jgi:hypothetical protein
MYGARRLWWGGARAARRPALALAIGLGLAAWAGCASPTVVPLASEGGSRRLENKRLGYRLDDPSSPAFAEVAAGGPAAAAGVSGASESASRNGAQNDSPSSPDWTRIEIDGADLAYRSGQAGDEATMIVASRCGGADAELRVLARHLLIGAGRREWIASGPAVVAGGEAWIQQVETRGEGAPVQVKTVTTRIDGCLVDWVLVSTRGFDRALPDFDRWWASFERPEEGRAR